MIILMIISVLLGVFFAQFGFLPDLLVSNSEDITNYSLYLLLILIGFSMGRDKEAIKKLFKSDYLAFLVPIGTIMGTLTGGYVASLFINLSASDSMAISAGFGWYSLSAVIISKMKSSDLGSIAFLANVSREIMSIVLIPFIAKYVGPYVSIAPGGATTMDTTLPIIEKYAGESAAFIAFIHGFILSAAVPVIVPLFL
jgi:uncharacterized membrane protein YbjE (DUF340 family)